MADLDGGGLRVELLATEHGRRIMSKCGPPDPPFCAFEVGADTQRAAFEAHVNAAIAAHWLCAPAPPPTVDTAALASLSGRRGIRLASDPDLRGGPVWEACGRFLVRPCARIPVAKCSPATVRSSYVQPDAGGAHELWGEDEDGEKMAIVVDAGSFEIRAGFAGEGFPRLKFPAVQGLLRFPGLMETLPWVRTDGGRGAPAMVGDDALRMRGVLTLRRPIEHGVTTDWDGMERIFVHTFANKLRVDPSEHPILVTEPMLNPKANRERLCQLMFETFNVPAYYTHTAPVLALYASGRTTGVVVDIGYDGVTVVPVIEGYPMPDAIGQQHGLGGRGLTEFLCKLLAEEQNEHFTTAGERELVRKIKEEQLRVSLDFEGLSGQRLVKRPKNARKLARGKREKAAGGGVGGGGGGGDIDTLSAKAATLNITPSAAAAAEPPAPAPAPGAAPTKPAAKTDASKDKKPEGGVVELPDGRRIDLSFLRYRCAEALFEPRRGGFQQIAGTNSKGLPELVSESIMKTDVDYRRELYRNIVVCGGAAEVPGLTKRLQQELVRAGMPPGTPKVLNVVTINRQDMGPPEGDVHECCPSWIGGSILGSPVKILQNNVVD